MTIENLIKKLAKEGELPVQTLSPAWQVTKWLLFTVLFFGGLTAFAGFRPDIKEKVSEIPFLIELGLAIFTTVFAGVAAVWLSLPDIRQQAWVRWLPFVPLSLLVAFLGSGIEPGMSEMAHAFSEECQMGKYDCAVHLVLLALIPGIILFFIMRRAAPVHYFWAGGMAVLAVTGSGYILMRLLEENDSFFHLFLWHFLPMVCCSIVGIFIGKWALRW